MVPQLLQDRGSSHGYDDTSQKRTSHRAIRRRGRIKWQALSAARQWLVGQHQGRGQAIDQTPLLDSWPETLAAHSHDGHVRDGIEKIQSGGISNAKVLCLFSDSADCTPKFAAAFVRSKCPGNDGRTAETAEL